VRLEAAVTRAIGRILEHPEIRPVIRRREGVVCGKLRVQRFRYNLVYTVIGDDVRIYAGAHHSRRPGYWFARFRIRWLLFRIVTLAPWHWPPRWRWSERNIELVLHRG
jgi:hypothetical protein